AGLSSAPWADSTSTKVASREGRVARKRFMTALAMKAGPEEGGPAGDFGMSESYLRPFANAKAKARIPGEIPRGDTGYSPGLSHMRATTSTTAARPVWGRSPTPRGHQ